jgi:hypothetical protein
VGFSRYTKQGPQPGKTVPYTLHGLRNPDGTSPVLHVEYVGESNRGFWMEALAKASAKASANAKAVRGPGTTPTEIDRERRAARDDNRETIIAHSARRIDNAFHDDGAPATPADIRAIVMALPDEDLDQLWAFVQNHNRFRDYTITEDPVALAEK